MAHFRIFEDATRAYIQFPFNVNAAEVKSDNFFSTNLTIAASLSCLFLIKEMVIHVYIFRNLSHVRADDSHTFPLTFLMGIKRREEGGIC